MKAKIFYGQAVTLADKIIGEINATCERVEVAGSIRRKKVIVGDIEIVCIPKYSLDLLGQPYESLLDVKLDSLVAQGRLNFEVGGERYKKYYIDYNGKRIYVDIFITTPDRWGVIFAIRTGSANFSKRLVTKKSQGGFCPNDMYVSDGYVWHNGFRCETPEERDVFALFGMQYIKPSERE